MFNMRHAALLALALFISPLVVGIKSANAGVYVCKNGSCNDWAAITDNQYNQTPGRSAARTCDNDVTVRKALNNANDNRIDNAVRGIAGWNIYLKSSLWHPGGTGILGCDTHLTGYLYKNEEERTTCHIIAIYYTEGKYWPTTCN